MNLPNKLTILRIILVPVFTALFFITALPYNYVLSAVVFAIAALTDFLDGYIARKYNIVTNLGKFLDPIADKALVATALIVLITSNGVCFGLGVDLTIAFTCLVALIIIRELGISGFRMIAAKRQLVLAADKIGKAKTFVTDFAILFLIVALDFSGKVFSVLMWIGYILFAIGAILTVVSGVNYIVKNKEVLKDSENA
ncbi:MAG: CDP-diacylglycerol--glycerol-3-phosphate 3-phosphatidyltransferase [Clostridia bacterium]|nr:CDP-diacylglycerol--glycerol-3-phosphate 3-phosphatidyltransferase [Clostridia bacterium]